MKIRKELIEGLIEIAKESHPYEFFALLTGKKGIIEEFIYIPFEQGNDFAGFNSSLLPVGMKIYGTVHTHPSESPYPSYQDLSTFSSFGKVHIIIYYPYCKECWNAFDRDGRKICLEVV